MMVDAITRAVIQKRMESIAEEMSLVLKLTGYSPNIKERMDFSCAIFDNQASLAAQAQAIPVHLGSMPMSVQIALKEFTKPLGPGDALIHNSPFRGGTHLPDITMMMPVFVAPDNQCAFYVANRAHHADVGGMVPGSMPGRSTEVFQEGIIIPPIRLFESGSVCEDIMSLILENVRTQVERKGDFKAQYASLTKGCERLQELCDTYGAQVVTDAVQELMSLSERATRQLVRSFPRKEMNFTDYLDSDGVSEEPVELVCRIEVDHGDNLIVDFTGTSPQREGNCNAPIAVTHSALYYVIRCLLEESIPTNAGCFRPLRIIAPEGSVTNPRWPAAVSSANTETSQRIVDAIWGALAQHVDLPAASQGTMNNILIGSSSGEAGAFSYYETIAGGIGASSKGAGEDALQSAMTNTNNTPIEALELAYPLQVLEYSIRRGSGGKGKFKGGNGVVRAVKVRVPATLSIQSERRVLAPWGLNGGKNGQKGKNVLLLPDGNEKELPGKITLQIEPDTVVKISTPGGGGWGEQQHGNDDA